MFLVSRRVFLELDVVRIWVVLVHRPITRIYDPRQDEDEVADRNRIETGLRYERVLFIPIFTQGNHLASCTLLKSYRHGCLASIRSVYLDCCTRWHGVDLNRLSGPREERSATCECGYEQDGECLGEDTFHRTDNYSEYKITQDRFSTGAF